MLNFGYYNMDCMDGMKEIPDKYFDLAVADPPYGINAPDMTMGTNKNRTNGGYPSTSTAERLKGRPDKGSGIRKDRALNTMDCTWDKKRPDKSYFKELFRVSKNQIIFGYNYFSDMLPSSRGIIVWDKCQPWETFSQAEIAWTSFDRPAALVRISNTGGSNEEKKIHPTQKPIRLYAWIYGRYTEPGMSMIDTHVGSASNLIAAHEAGIHFMGFEKNKVLYESSASRLRSFVSQTNIFDFPEVIP